MLQQNLKNSKHRLIIAATLCLLTIMPIISAAPASAFDIKNILKTTETPIKGEKKNVVGKFLNTMFLVVGSCVFIYAILAVYKRRKGIQEYKQPEAKDISEVLESPDTIDDAVDFVIKKF